MNLRRLRGSVNLPLAQDLLAMRISVQDVQRDGYVENLSGGPDGGDIDMLNSRAQILFTPGEHFDVTLGLDYLEADSIGYTSEGSPPSPLCRHWVTIHPTPIIRIRCLSNRNGTRAPP